MCGPGLEIMESTMDDKLTKKEKEELEKLKNEILDEAKKVVEDYVDNPSKSSGSMVRVHENSPYLDTELGNDEPLYSGSRWTKVIKSF